MSLPNDAVPHDIQPTQAVIDIGSNTVRLVVYGGPPRAPVVVLNEKVTARLGNGVAESGLLSEKAMSLALAGLQRYRMLLDLAGVAHVEVTATAAVREAKNQKQFLEKVRALGFKPRVLSGVEEAITSAHGVQGAFPSAQGVVADLGGGSFELIDMDGARCSHGMSVPLGTLRLPKLRAKEGVNFGGAIARILRNEGWQAHAGQTLYCVGGGLRAFARYAMVTGQWVTDDPHGVTIKADLAESWARELSRAKGDDLQPISGVSSSRLIALPDVAALLAAVIMHLKPSRLVFSAWGLREGVVYQGMPKKVQAQDPLIESVAAFAAHYGVTIETARAAVQWIIPLTQEEAVKSGEKLSKEGAFNKSSIRENVSIAIALLCFASIRLEANVRGDQVITWALRKRWIGVRCEERVVMAIALRAFVGRLDVEHSWRNSVPPEMIAEAQALGMGLRFVRRLCLSHVQILPLLTWGRLGAGLRLKVPLAYAPLMTNIVERDLKSLGQILGVRLDWHAQSVAG